MKARKLGVFLGAVLLCGTCLGDELSGRNAPEITVREWITANPPNLKDLAGRVYVVEFWALWCRPCVENIPHLIELNNRYKSMGVEFIALSQDKSAEKVREFVRWKRINYSVAIDDGTADWFGIRGYPTVAVVNHRNEVVWQGYPWNLKFEEAISRAVEEGPPPLLGGIDLGAFVYLKKPLCGGRKFADAYREIESHINDDKDPATAEVAKQIIETINLRVSQRIKEAEQLRRTEPGEAYNIYADIVARYEGIKAVEAAKRAYLELKKTRWASRTIVRNKDI